MSEIADMLQQKAGLSPDQAQQVEQLVAQHLMSRVPPEFQGMLTSVLGMGSGSADAPAASGGMGSLLGMAEGFLGKK